jgi:hypothetical protein
MALCGRVINAPLLTLAQRRAMFALFDAHYLNADWTTFCSDLAEKPWVILIEDEAGERVRGFSTQMIVETRSEGKRIRALFSGDTVIDRESWGDQALARTWGRFALSLMERWPEDQLYWLLISKGYKTYRFLPLFFHEFYPRYDQPAPAWAKELLDRLAAQKFGSAYEASRSVVRANPSKDRLRPGVADVTPQRLRDPHVHFFVQRNSGHQRGDELCCLAPLIRSNFTEAAWRVIGAPFRAGEERLCPLPAG